MLRFLRFSGFFGGAPPATALIRPVARRLVFARVSPLSPCSPSAVARRPPGAVSLRPAVHGPWTRQRASRSRLDLAKVLGDSRLRRPWHGWPVFPPLTLPPSRTTTPLVVSGGSLDLPRQTARHQSRFMRLPSPKLICQRSASNAGPSWSGATPSARSAPGRLKLLAAFRVRQKKAARPEAAA
jgi:hypothetical protein